MHIVLVCREYVGSARGGGIGSYMQEIARAYIAKGHRVTVVTASDNTKKQSETLTSDGIKIISLSGGDFLVPSVEGNSRVRKLRCLYRFHSYRRKLKRVIGSISDTDIVEVADFGAEGLYLQNLNVPVVVRLHTPQSLSRRSHGLVKPEWWQIYRTITLRAERDIFAAARYMTGCSQAILRWVSAHFDISGAKTAVINNPVSVSRINVTDKGSDGHKVIFYAGTISDTKGVGDLVDACVMLRDKGFDIRLRLAGKGGSFQTMLQKRVMDNGWSWIEFLGKLSREDVFSNYCSADVCCFPSWWENMPMVVLESMALGAVVVSTDAGGTGEIITDGFDGYLCQRRNPMMLSNTLHKALTLSPVGRNELKENAKQTIRDRFSIEKISTEMLEFFHEVIADFKQNHI